MKLDRLYLLKPNFMDNGKGPYFCPGCAEIIGLLEFYPTLSDPNWWRCLEKRIRVARCWC